MEATRAHLTAGSAPGGPAHADRQNLALLHSPFEMRHGRRYLRDVGYPLPCDLDELHRQNLRTLLGCRVFGRAVCSSVIDNEAGEEPLRVLDLGCGTGYWSAMCHDYFTAMKMTPAVFVGVDIAPVAADLRLQGVDWTFVQHDLRRMPLPFEDGEFDLVMAKDLSLALTTGSQTHKLLDEGIRLLRDGGTLEIWETDHVVRSLQRHAAPLKRRTPDLDIADLTATYPTAIGTPFAPAQNRYLAQANDWIERALDLRRYNPTPCVRIAEIMLQESELRDVGVRRIAVPLGEMPWEKIQQSADGDVAPPRSPVLEREDARPTSSSASSSTQLSNSSPLPAGLTVDQRGLRHTALVTVLQMIDHMEPILKDVSGKTSVEWNHWWTALMSSLLDPACNTLEGECLEIGAWWATKVSSDS